MTIVRAKRPDNQGSIPSTGRDSAPLRSLPAVPATKYHSVAGNTLRRQNILFLRFMYMYNNHCHRETAHLQLNILLLLFQGVKRREREAYYGESARVALYFQCPHVQDGIRGWPAGPPTHSGWEDVTGKIGNSVLINSDLHTWMNFSENYPQFGHALSKIFAKPVLRRQSLKDVGFEGHQIISLLGAPTLLGPALHAYPMRGAALHNGTTSRFSVPYTQAFYNTNSN
jgi:hypothetical protein